MVSLVLQLTEERERAAEAEEKRLAALQPPNQASPQNEPPTPEPKNLILCVAQTNCACRHMADAIRKQVALPEVDQFVPIRVGNSSFQAAACCVEGIFPGLA